MPKLYAPQEIEENANEIWNRANAFHAGIPDGADSGPTYTIVIPPPNVTAALHLGHALNNTLQDILIRWRRMQGYHTLWMPGTDHAGIATQTVVEKRILAEEGKRRTDFERDEFVERVQAWKDEYEAKIIEQLKKMGCSCDWERVRFTMDEVCAKAVRANFFNLFRDGLIYRGKRLVNWDPATQTVLADDEVEYETVQGHFWYMKYPLVEAVECNTGFQPVENNEERENMGKMPVVQRISKRRGAYIPHWIREGATYAVTFRLGDSVPADVSEQWQQERKDIIDRAKQQNRELTIHEVMELKHLFSDKIESYLNAGHGECVLKDSKAAKIVQDALLYFHGNRYELVAWVIMPNHVHVVVRPLGDNELSEIVHSWKSFSADEINKVLNRTGNLWMVEYHDHLICDESDFENQVAYVLENPEKAGLKEWEWIGCFDRDELWGGQDACDTITHVTVATTRPETMLGDTAVAMNPRDPRAGALVGKMVRLPIVGRLIPIIADEHVVLPDPESSEEKAKYSTGFLKVTPAHDPDDWAIGLRHGLPVINVMAPDGSISDKYGWEDARGEDSEAEAFLGMDRFEAREAIVEWFRQEDLLEKVRDYTHDVGHSYRSHVPIEPYLSDQWYIAVKKPIEHLAETIGGGTIEGTDVPVNSLAGLALKPLLDGRLRFIPERYAKTYQTWLENLRDWPISRQLWWGHQIPVWSKAGSGYVFSEYGDHVKSFSIDTDEGAKTFVCVGKEHIDIEQKLEADGWQRDSDVLDTWFSSALWPFSTLGWPEEGVDGEALMKHYYPGSVLCTAREIITLWVSRMVMMGQYCAGDIPFKDVFIHAMIQDGQGRKMSKSLGNGIDPLVAIDSHGADAMRFALASMTTQTQDVRMPVEEMALPDGRVVNTSPKFDIGRNFCNKLWNASRFALGNLEDPPTGPFEPSHMTLEDQWILSRLADTIDKVTTQLEEFKFSEPINQLYRFFWNELCDWYLELIKPRMRDEELKPTAQRLLAFVLDNCLRLLHPFLPFITEGIYQQLHKMCSDRGLGNLAKLESSELLITAEWPKRLSEFYDAEAEQQMGILQATIRAIRDVRTQYQVPPKKKLNVSVRTHESLASLLNEQQHVICNMTASSAFVAGPNCEKPLRAATAVSEEMEIYVDDVIDPAAEKKRLEKQQEELTKGIAGSEKKLANENFISRAKPEVVERERERLAQLKEQLASVKKNLADLE